MGNKILSESAGSVAGDSIGIFAKRSINGAKSLAMDGSTGPKQPMLKC